MRNLKFLAFFIASAITSTTLSADFTTYSGEQLFERLCASCHGKDATGNGPVASSLNVQVPNLRELTRRHRGEFPVEKLEGVIDGRIKVAPHGTRVMPVWGEELLRSEMGDAQAEKDTAALIHKIVEYLRSIQTTVPTNVKN